MIDYRCSALVVRAVARRRAFPCQRSIVHNPSCSSLVARFSTFSSSEDNNNDINDVSSNDFPFTPSIHPEFKITSDPLPPDIARAVQEHTENLWRAPEKERDIVRDARLDNRKQVKKKRGGTKKKTIKSWRGGLNMTPFVAIAAHRRIVDRLQKMDSSCPYANEFLQAKIQFSYFQKYSDAVQNKNHAPIYEIHQKFVYPKRHSPKAFIDEEVIAMMLQPLVEPYFGAHSFCRREEQQVYQKSFLDEALKLAQQDDDDTIDNTFLTWNLIDETNKFLLNEKQIKIIANHLKPYMPMWVVNRLFGLFKEHKRLAKKKIRYWDLYLSQTHDTDAMSLMQNQQKLGSFASLTRLPVYLTDLVFLNLDFSDAPHAHPLWTLHQQHLKSDKKKNKIGTVPAKGLPQTLDDACQMAYHRVGPAIVVSYFGPEKLQEKLIQQIETFLKSNQAFARNLVECKPIVVKGGRRGKKKKAERLAKWEDEYEKHEAAKKLAFDPKRRAKRERRKEEKRRIRANELMQKAIREAESEDYD